MRLPLATLILALTLLPACGKDDTCDATCTTGADTNLTGTGTGTTTATAGTATTTTGTTTGEPTTTGTNVTTTDGSDSINPTSGTSSTTDGTASTTTTGGTTTTTTTGDTTGDTGVVPGGACVKDSDCMLHDDCCDCFAVPAGDNPPICKKGCDQTQCELQAIDQALCRFGVCVTEKVPCDPSKVACDALPPKCPMGQVASVAGACWSGQCVPATSCDVVPDCDLCPDNFMCVFMEAQIPMPLGTCEPVPAQCEGKIDCGCSGQTVCVDPFNACNKIGDNELHCACPAC
ncbi:MAG: hypothetical protein H0T76_18465 [Nannocystis sp.]|nr:hypothetical protein [Nannocystis sp.]MBA3548470.1 hypothetical protein [Nannocystis sp.]